MQEIHKHFINNNRRNFLKKTGLCIGGLALGSIVNPFENNNEDPFSVINNPNLTCISVDDPTWSTANWTNIDSQSYFSSNCNPSAIKEQTTNKEILKITDLLGRETKGNKNEPLLYLYDDGTVEKRITID